MNKFKLEKGITLVALVITIIVLLILAVVAIGAVRDSGIIGHAQNSADKYNTGKADEESKLKGFEDEIKKYETEGSFGTSGEGSGELIPGEDEITDKTLISKTETYIGYYADVDGNGSVDGIIYADLAFDGSGKWTDDEGAYSYSKKENLNNYYISQEAYKHKNFEEKPVLAPIDKVEENDRFYVMALEDFNPGTDYHWYNSAYTFEGQMKDYQTDTSPLFEKGKENASNMIGVWKAGKYGAGDTGSYKDIWGQIDAKVAEGWFVPSKEELAAFGDMATKQGMTKTNYPDYGLSSDYWSSSQSNASLAWYADFFNGYMDNRNVDYSKYVRLSTTF